MIVTNETVDKFAGIFTPYYIDNYGVQFDHESRKWYRKYRNMCSHLVRGHLTGEFWISVPPTWYTHIAFIDNDDPLYTPHDRILETLNFFNSEYYRMSSPGYFKSGKEHSIFKPQYKHNDTTKKLFWDTMSPYVKSTGAELFPRGNRLFRVPNGRDQNILDENGNPLDLSPEEFMFWIDKLDYYEISEKITYQTSMLSNLYPDTSDPLRCTTSWVDARIFEKHGLQSMGSRHDACIYYAMYCYNHLNIPPEKTKHRLRRLLRKKHHGYSKEINKGNWLFVDKEIEETVDWVYINFTGSYLPNSTHNFKHGLATPEDVKGAVEIYRGDWINIKRTIELFQYSRMRQFFPWIYIPVSIWDKVASHQYYIDYQNDLLKKGTITDVRTDYLAGHYSKSYRIKQPRSFSSPITNDKRAVTDHATLLLRTFGTPRDAVNATGINRWTASRLFDRS
ncbi:hypothetical protein ES703_57923 [subsurface metagenome]